MGRKNHFAGWVLTLCLAAVCAPMQGLSNEDANPFVRLQAAQAVLDMAVKSRTVDELEERIAALEQTQDSSF